MEESDRYDRGFVARMLTYIDETEGYARPSSSGKRMLRVALEEFGVSGTGPRQFILDRLLTLLPQRMFWRTRLFLYRLFGFRIGRGAMISGTMTLWGGRKIQQRLNIGRNVLVITPSYIGLDGPVSIGDRVVIAMNVTILTANHRMGNAGMRAGTIDVRPVTIGDGAWIATGATILPGVTIGAGAVVGAGSLVTRDVPPNALVAGNPARLIRMLDPGEGPEAADVA